MNFRKVNSYLLLVVSLVVAIIAIIYSSAVVSTAYVYSDNTSMTADVTVVGTGNGGSGNSVSNESSGGGGGSAGVTNVYDVVTGSGRFLSDVTAKSADRTVVLYIPKDTIGLNRNGYPLITIGIKEKVPTPHPPENAEIIELVYEITPSGSTFSPPVTLTFQYEENQLPQGVAEKNLVIASYDTQNGQWRNMECVVDIENNTVTTQLDILSIYSILAYTRPASFQVTDFSINPIETNIGEEISISLLVTNTGDLAGSYEVVLKINDIVRETREITLDGGASRRVSFSVIQDVAGIYTISIGGLYGWLEVKEPVSEGVVAEVPAPETSVPVQEPAPELTTPLTTPLTIPKTPEVSHNNNGYNWSLIIMLYGGMLVVIGVLVYLLRRYG